MSSKYCTHWNMSVEGLIIHGNTTLYLQKASFMQYKFKWKLSLSKIHKFKYVHTLMAPGQKHTIQGKNRICKRNTFRAVKRACFYISKLTKNHMLFSVFFKQFEAGMCYLWVFPSLTLLNISYYG